ALHRQRFGTVPCVLEGLRFERMLVCDTKRPPTLVLSHDPASRRFTVHSKLPVEGAAWTAHAQGHLRHLPEPASTAPLDLPNLRRTCPRPVAPAELYRQLDERGLHYG